MKNFSLPRNCEKLRIISRCRAPLPPPTLKIPGGAHFKFRAPSPEPEGYTPQDCPGAEFREIQFVFCSFRTFWVLSINKNSSKLAPLFLVPRCPFYISCHVKGFREVRGEFRGIYVFAFLLLGSWFLQIESTKLPPIFWGASRGPFLHFMSCTRFQRGPGGSSAEYTFLCAYSWGPVLFSNKKQHKTSRPFLLGPPGNLFPFHVM